MFIIASSSKSKSHLKKTNKICVGIQGRKKKSLKSLQFKDESQGMKNANLSSTTSGPEHKAADIPCNTVIHWGVYCQHFILHKCFKRGWGKGHHIKCLIPVYNGDNLDLKFIAGGKTITSKFYPLQTQESYRKMYYQYPANLDFKYIKIIQYIGTLRQVFKTQQVLQNYESLHSMKEIFHKAERAAIL